MMNRNAKKFKTRVNTFAINHQTLHLKSVHVKKKFIGMVKKKKIYSDSSKVNVK